MMIYLAVLLFAGLTILAFSILAQKKKNEKERNLAQSKVPDTPQGFGYKRQWLAVKSDDPKKVAEALDLQTRACNWGYGLSTTSHSKTFISPPIDGWVLVVGYAMDMPNTATGTHLLQKLSRTFGECQFFITHRVSEYHAWAKAIAGELVRFYIFECCEDIIVSGKMTRIEHELKVPETLPRDEKEWEDNQIVFPDESTLMEVADSWSIDPTLLGAREDLEGLGLLSI